MNRYPLYCPALVLALAAAAGLSALVVAESPLRPLCAVAFLLLGPGLALVPLLHLGDILAELTLAAAVSLALATGVATTMISANFWHPQAGLILLIALSVVGAAAQVLLRLTRTSSSEAMHDAADRPPA